MQSYKNAVNYRNLILLTFSETVEYTSWSDEFARKECLNVRSLGKNYPVDLTDLSYCETKELGFVQWTKDSPLLLIPLWLLPTLNPDAIVECINGKTMQVRDIDNDNRGGLLAYGVRIGEE